MEPDMSLLDFDAIDKLKQSMGDGAAEIIIDLIDSLEHEVNKLLPAFQQALAQGDAEQLQRAAHSLKGSSAALGAVALSNLCLEIETFARQGLVTEAQDLATQIDQISQNTIAALRNINL